MKGFQVSMLVRKKINKTNMFQRFDYISKASIYFSSFIITTAHDFRGVERSRI